MPLADPDTGKPIIGHPPDEREDLVYWQNGEPGLWLTYWAHKDTSDGTWTPQWVVKQAKARGFGWIAAQAEDTPADVAQHLRVECAANDVACVVWEAAVDYGSPVRTAAGWAGYIGQVEGPGQYVRLISSKWPDGPKAVVTNFGGLDTYQLAKPLIDAGFYFIVESHVKESPATPAAQVDFAVRVLRVPPERVSPMAGLGGGATLADYPGLETFPAWSAYSAEYLL